MTDYNICYSLDSKYTEQLCASITSIIINSEENQNFNFYILDGGLSERDKLRIKMLKNIKKFNIEYFKMNDSDFENCPMLKNKSDNYKDYHVTLPTYYRFILPDILPELDKILYLDCDVIAKGSLKNLLEENINDLACAMVQDAESEKEALRLNTEKYFNAGVMLINLDYWRKNNIKNKLFEYAKDNQEKIIWQDQDIINAVLDGEIKELFNIWNYQYFQYENVDSKKCAQAHILHFAGRFKPWLMHFESEIYDEYYEYLKLTPFKNKVTEYKLNASGKRLKNNIGGSVTNIVLNADNKDIENCYKEITKNYNYITEQNELINSNTDDKISKVYEEISNNYNYIDKKINEQNELINSNTDDKISKVYEEISNNYNYIDKKINEQNELINSNTDDKISKVYEEISNNYNYIDRKINEQNELINSNTDDKISQVSKYTEYLVKVAEEKQNHFRMESENTIYKYIYDVKANLEHSISTSYEDITKNTDDKLNSLSYDFAGKLNYEIKTLASDITKETDLKFSEIYSYTNEHASKLYKEVKSSSDTIENNLNNKISDLYKSNEEFNSKINILQNEIDDCSKKHTVVELRDNIDKIIEQKDFEHAKEVNTLKADFEEKINNQRIKYEHKLMSLENQLKEMNLVINELKKSPIDKFLEKFRGKK